jgi:hypothetical protein
LHVVEFFLCIMLFVNNLLMCVCVISNNYRILAVLEGFPNGISNQKISEHFDSQTPQNVLNAMNKLLSQVNT